MDSKEKATLLKDRLKAIDSKFETPSGKTALQQQITGAKSSRGPSLAGRISGLQKLQPKLGQQFSKTKTVSLDE